MLNELDKNGQMSQPESKEGKQDELRKKLYPVQSSVQLKEGVIPLTEKLRNEYTTDFFSCSVKNTFVQPANRILLTINKNRATYLEVAYYVKVPYILIGCIHYLESNFNWNSHLHNGDPLTARTVNIPKGRPKFGEPPFSWIESAIDALFDYGFNGKWSIPEALYTLEKYNGFGYRRKGIKSPYLFSGTTLYGKGKYVADGKFDPNAVSKQIGAVCILKLQYMKLLSITNDSDKAVEMMLVL